MTDVVIIGAGLTGLSTAYQLIQNGQTRVHILERQPRIGGVIHSHSEDGFIYESGPTTGVIGSIELAELLEAFPDIVQTNTEGWMFLSTPFGGKVWCEDSTHYLVG